jgi:ribulose-phosphate 3-epimerase
LGKKAGLTLKPSTSLASVEPLLDAVDLVLVMTVEPGFSGQKFRTDQIDKVKTLRRAIDAGDWPVLIEVDGGIDDKTAPLVRDADVLVAGNFVFKNDYRTAIAKLKQLGE